MPKKRRSSDFEDSDDEDYLKHPQRNAANARERARMRVLSKAFCRLKTTLPWVPADTKLSKLDTLRLATSYIAHLRAVLMNQTLENDQVLHPLTLTWPFTFQKTEFSADVNEIRTNEQHWNVDVSLQPVVKDENVSYY